MHTKLEEFENALKSQELMSDSHLPYMVWWVKHYLDLNHPGEASYSDAFSKEGKHDWQIRQALDAVKLYRQFSTDEEKKVVESDHVDPLETVIRKLSVRHYARSTVKSYSSWCRNFIEFCSSRKMKPQQDSSFISYLSFLALKKNVAASTQNQAVNAILFLFRNVWNREPEGIDAVRARKPKRLPVVLSMEGGSFIFIQYEKYSLYVFHETPRNKCNPDNLKGERSSRKQTIISADVLYLIWLAEKYGIKATADHTGDVFQHLNYVNILPAV